jgi:hypothetical protein
MANVRYRQTMIDLGRISTKRFKTSYVSVNLLNNGAANTKKTFKRGSASNSWQHIAKSVRHRLINRLE